MHIEELREYCLTLPAAEEGCPFGETTLVFKVAGKIFLLTSLGEHPLKFNVKCLPEKAIELREEYPCVLPGYHMNKKHWNTIVVDGSLPNRRLKKFIEESYLLVAPKTKVR